MNLKFWKRRNKRFRQSAKETIKSTKPVFKPMQIDIDLFDKLNLTEKTKASFQKLNMDNKNSKVEIFVQEINLKITELESFYSNHPNYKVNSVLLNKTLENWKAEKDNKDKVLVVQLPVNVIEVPKTDKKDEVEINWILKEYPHSFLCASPSSIIKWNPENQEEKFVEDISKKILEQELTATMKIFEILKNSLDEASMKIKNLNNGQKLKSVDLFLNEYSNAKDKENIKILEGKNSELQKNLNDTKNKLNSIENENEKLTSELLKFKERISFVEFARDYAVKALSFLNLARETEKQAYKLSEKLILFNKTEALLLFDKSFNKYMNVVLEVDVFSWEQELSMITSNNVIFIDSKIYTFMLSEEEVEKKKEGLIFQLYKKLFVRFCSAVLILNEELSNLHKLTEIDKNDISYFNSNTENILTAIAKLSFRVDYVKLYSSLRNQTNIDGRKINFDISGIESDDIVEILNYAIHYGNAEVKTKVIFKE